MSNEPASTRNLATPLNSPPTNGSTTNMVAPWCASRRIFLSVVGTTVAGAPLLACSSAVPEPDNVGQVDAGLASSYPVGSLEAIGNLAVALGHDEGGFYALTLTCTHQGCNMAVQGAVSGAGIACACHGATYSVDGTVRGGPAKANLTHFAVKIDPDTGAITIDGNTRVSANVRTPAV
jgi:Rieske Fe-S protein